MIRKSLLFVCLLLVSGAASAQNWVDMGPFPDSTMFWRGAHGVAVDAENKVWLVQYYPSTTPVVNGDTVKVLEGATGAFRTSSLHVYDVDGKKAMEPIHAFTYGGMTDTLAYDTAVSRNPTGIAKRITGIKADHNGDIIVMVGQSVSLMFRLDHKTGEVMNRTNLESEAFTGSPASPGVDGAGNIYVAPVSANAPISIFNSEFRWIGNVSDNSPGIGRALEVTEDGNTVYWSSFTGRTTYKYQRKDEFSQYDSIGVVHEGLIAQGSARHPTTGHIWLGHSKATGIDLDPTGMFGPGSELTLFEINPMAEDGMDMIVDSLEFNSPFEYCASGLNRNVRGIAFSPDGAYAYVGIFDAIQGLNSEGDCSFLLGIAPPNEVRGFVFKKFMRGMVTSIDRDPTEIPDGFTLSQNYPNPFNPQTNITFEIKDAGLATLKVYDVLGREVATLVDEHLVAGKYTATFTASDLSSGTYIYRLDVLGNRLSGKMMLVK